MKKRLLMAGLLATAGAEARLYNYEDIPLGERSSGMGMTSIAVEGDSGNMYKNPATQGWSKASQFNASVSTYARIDTRTGQYVSIFRSSLDNISRGGALKIPAMLGGHIKLGNWILGGSILIPEYYTNSGTLDVSATKTASFESREDSLWGGFFAAYPVSKDWTVGLSIFYATRSSFEKFLFLSRNSSVDPLMIRYVEQIYDTGAMFAVLGATYQINDQLRLGFSFRPPAAHFGGQGSYIDQSSGDTTVSPKDFSTTFYPQPMRASFGLAWQITPQWLVAGDMSVYSAFGRNLSSIDLPVFDVETNEVVNGSLGVEWRALKWLGGRLGVYTNFSAVKFLPLQLSALQDKVHMFGATAAIFFPKETGSISIGGYVQGGQGSSSSITNVTGPLVPRTNYIYGVVIGSSYMF